MSEVIYLNSYYIILIHFVLKYKKIIEIAEECVKEFSKKYIENWYGIILDIVDARLTSNADN
jgi:hypothetical protein